MSGLPSGEDAETDAPDLDALQRFDAVYEAAKAVTGREIPRVGQSRMRPQERALVLMVRALAVAVAVGEVGDRATHSKQILFEPAAITGIPIQTLYNAVSEMERLLVGRPAERQVILDVLACLDDQHIKVVLPEAWRAAIDFAW